MKEPTRVKEKIYTFLMSRKGKIRLGFMVFYLLILFAIRNNAWAYDTEIAKIVEVHTEITNEKQTEEGKKEIYYKQNIKGVILNGTWRGESIWLENEYTKSEVLNQKYQKGNQIFLQGIEKDSKIQASIKGLKRDTYIVGLLGILLLLLIFITGQKGIRTSITLILNISIYAVGFSLYLKGWDILKVCNVMVIFFTIGTLCVLNGWNTKTLAAIISTLCVLVLIMLIFELVLRNSPKMDYSTMEYLGSMKNPKDIFHAEILLAGLGAIMDVTVTIAAALGELIHKKPEITLKELFQSGREVGYDIMGTMINVLLFTFGCGLIPSFLIQMNNGIHFLTIVRLYIPFEICRFLIESIGIVLAIPVSIVIASFFMKRRRIEA